MMHQQIEEKLKKLNRKLNLNFTLLLIMYATIVLVVTLATMFPDDSNDACSMYVIHANGTVTKT